MRTTTVEVHGGRLVVDEAGDGEPLLLLHGFSLDARVWDDVVPALAERFRVLTLDLRGFGRSTVPDGPYHLVDDVAAVLRALDAAPAHLVGLSMGGGVALATAIAHPDVVRSVVSIDGFVAGFPGTKDWTAGAVAARTLGLEAAKAGWLEDELLAHARPAGDARLRAMIDRYTGFHWLNADPGRWFVGRFLDRLPEVRVPTLAVVGALDHPDFLGAAALIEARVPGARRLVLDGVGHLPPLEAPEATAAAILDFVG